MKSVPALYKYNRNSEKGEHSAAGGDLEHISLEPWDLDP